MKINNKIILVPFSICVVAILNFLITAFLVKILDISQYGKVAILKPTILIFSSIFGLGLSQGYIYFFSGSRGNEIIKKKHLKYLLRYSIIGSILFIFFLFFLDNNEFFNLSIIIPSFFLIILIIANNDLISFYRADEKYKVFPFLNIFRSSIFFFLIIFISFIDKTFINYISSYFIAELIIFIFLVKPFLNTKINSGKFELPKRYLSISLPHCFLISLGFLYAYADRFILSFFSMSYEFIGQYDIIVFLIISTIGILSRSVNLVLYPRLSTLESKKKIQQINYIFFITRLFYSASSLIVGIFILLFSKYLILFLIPNFDINFFEYFIYFIIIFYINGVKNINGTIYHIKNMTNDFLKINFFGFLIYILISTFLFNIYNFKGIIIGLLVGSIFSLLFSFKKIKNKIDNFYWDILLCCSLLMIINYFI